MKSFLETLAETAAGKHWQRIGIRHHHGILIPLAAIHTERSCGIGEFLDLIPLIDWCNEVGFNLIQLLPLNNSSDDPSPYCSESVCALNWMHLSLSELPGVDCTELTELQALILTPVVEYGKVSCEKLRFLRSYFEKRKGDLSSEVYLSFVASQPWLQPYALFKTLKTQFRSLPWRTWPSHLQCLKKEEIQALYPLYAEEMAFHCFLQYLCYQQMVQVKAYAKERQVFLMGDLPILLNQESVENWQFVECFSPDLGAGSPPDIYNEEGQNWNLPILNWDVFKKEGFSFWKERLAYAENFYDLFRIDHILGFFRIFAIPFHHPSKEGRYIPDNPPACMRQGEEVLEMVLSSTQMLPIGEDLGVVPSYVRPCLKKWGVCGTRVVRWEKEEGGENRFIDLSCYEPLSLCCVSTPDSEPLSLFWKECKEEARSFAVHKGWDYREELTAAEREELLRDSHQSASLFHVNLLQEYLALIPSFVHADPKQERINIPGTILPSNWVYRFLPSVQEIRTCQPLKDHIKKILIP